MGWFNWKDKQYLFVFDFGSCGMDRYTEEAGQQPSGCFRTARKFYFKSGYVWLDKHHIFFHTDLGSGSYILSFFSYACAWRRRYQIVFRY